jgi:hypothetical protein
MQEAYMSWIVLAAFAGAALIYVKKRRQRKASTANS